MSMNDARVALVAMLALGILAASPAADAQKPEKVYRIGYTPEVPTLGSADPRRPAAW
jgi:hypothetical protein